MAKIFVNAGHGGKDPGALSADHKHLEKNYTLAVATNVTRLLTAAGQTVRQNRTTDTDRTITADANAANAWGADAVIEIHLNADPDPDNAPGLPEGQGTETYHSISGGKSKQLAEEINRRIVLLGFRDRGAKTRQGVNGDYFGIIRQTKAPAVLIETAFVDSPQDMAKYNVQTMAKAIADGICAVFPASAVNPPAPVPTPAPSGLPYRVRVLDAALNIRKGAGTHNPVVDVIRDKGVYTIVQESKVGSTTWGKLKSGVGWISLGEKYCKRL